MPEVELPKSVVFVIATGVICGWLWDTFAYLPRVWNDCFCQRGCCTDLCMVDEVLCW